MMASFGWTERARTFLMSSTARASRAILPEMIVADILFSNLPYTIFKKGFDGLTSSLINKFGVGNFVIFCKVSQSNDLFTLQIRQTFMITIREGFTHYLLHKGCSTVLIKFLKRIIIFLAVDKFNIDGHKTFSDKQIIVDNASYSTVTIIEWMKTFKSKM